MLEAIDLILSLVARLFQTLGNIMEACWGGDNDLPFTTCSQCDLRYFVL